MEKLPGESYRTIPVAVSSLAEFRRQVGPAGGGRASKRMRGLGLRLLWAALLAAILAYYGYDAALPMQSRDTILGIKAAISIYASIPFFAASALLVFYVIGKEMEGRIETELHERRTAAAPPEAPPTPSELPG